MIHIEAADFSLCERMGKWAMLTSVRLLTGSAVLGLTGSSELS
jgi:hypothetical protein